MEAVQHTKDTVPIDLGGLLDAGDGAVVTLIAGDTRLAAHRAVLSARSPVFSAMFQHDTVEAGSGEVAIADVEGEVLRQLLSYLYTLRVPQLSGMAPQLLAAADKYGVDSLKAACEQQVAAQLAVETAAAAAVLAVRHSCADLRKAAVTFIKANFLHVVGTRGWADAVRTQPEDVVEVSQLLAEPPAETSAPAPAVSGTSYQPHSGGSRHSGTPASATPAAAASRHTTPPDDATVSCLRNLPAEEKTRRLREAAEEGDVRVMEALLAAGADVAARERFSYYDGYTALHIAASQGRVEAARLLLAWGALVDARTDDGYTPLHEAARCGHAAVVRLLLAASANHSARCGLRETALHIATSRGDAEMVAALLDAGADRAATDLFRRTPLDMARRSNNQQLVDLLSR